MLNNQAERHRARIESVVTEHTYQHQRDAASRTFAKFEDGAKAVVIAAEMQSGKSGVALALACLQRLALSDADICDRKQLKDTLYLVTMADLALLDQAQQDLGVCPNIVISNFNNFRYALSQQFKQQAPKLIIIDECHYGSGSEAIRYSLVFDYLEQENPNCKIAFISATPFSALYAAGADSILRHQFNTRLVFHKTSHEYRGIREMHKNLQIVKLDNEQRDFCEDSLLRRRFIRQLQEHQGAGWSLIRVPSGSAQRAKNILLAHGISEDQIYVIGQKLTGLDDHELCSINEFKIAYDNARLFDDKVVAITVAGFRAGINFGQTMKEELINSWDSTIANIAAVVQANIGRACGYHSNTFAKHYTNLDAIKAYSDLLDYLEQSDDTNDFAGLHQLFEDICSRYQINGFDRGISVAPQLEASVSTKRDDSRTYLTARFLCVPAKLHESQPDFLQYTQDADLLAAIDLIRQEYLNDNGPFIKKNRALRGDHQNWIKAQWVNGVSYDNHTQSGPKARILSFIEALNNGEPVEFNLVVNPGGGEATEDKRVMATIFSVYNLSAQMDSYKRGMTDDDVFEMCDALQVERDDTLIVLFKRGEYSESLTQEKEQSQEIIYSRIRDKSVFSNQ